MKPEERNIVELDVRPMLAAKIEPFSAIMQKVKSLKESDWFVLHAPFKPVPLFKVMARKGFHYEAERVGKRHWKVTFWKSEADMLPNRPEASAEDSRATEPGSKVHRLDNRGLEPPQPMIRTLSRLEKMGDDETLIIHNDRPPMFLYPELDALGYPHETEEAPEGGYRITIRKK